MSSLTNALEEMRRAIHARCLCDNPRCACDCGCERHIGCACFSQLCLQCHMNWLRGRDPEPGADRPCDLPEPAALAPADDEGGQG